MEPRQVPDDTEKTPQLEVQLTPPAPSVPFYPPDSLTVGVESSSQEHPVLSDNVEPWPPQPPDVDLSDAITDTEQKPFATGSFSQIHVYKGNRALKHGANPRELVLMRQAGECSVQAFGRVMMKDKKTGVVWMTGMMMSLERPLVVTKVEPNLRKHLMYQMIDLVHCLHHRYGIVHGDLKPDNMLLCSDGRLRFCDFAEARPMNEDPELWEGQTTANYLAPDRNVNKPPTFSDDLYALGLSIWQLYTSKGPFEDWDVDDIDAALARKETVDLSLVQDDDVREIIKEYLRQGGALFDS